MLAAYGVVAVQRDEALGVLLALLVVTTAFLLSCFYKNKVTGWADVMRMTAGWMSCNGSV